MIERVIYRMAPLNRQAMAECQLRLDNLIKPLNSLGAFEKMACQMAGVFGVARPQLPPRSLLLAGCGVRRPGAMTRVFAEHAGAELVWFAAAPGEKLTDMRSAVEAGIRAARQETEKGSRILGLGILGEAAAAAGYIMEHHGVYGGTPLELLTEAGSPEIAGVVGMILGAASERAVAVLDDEATFAGALIAAQLAPLAKDYLAGSHSPATTGGAEALRRLEIKTYLHLGLNLGEGAGAAVGISLLKASLHVLNDMKTFGEAEVPVAEDGPGAGVQKPSVRS